MDIERIREIVRRCRDFTRAEVIYKNKDGGLVTRTCYLNPFDNTLKINSFKDIPQTYRDDYKKKYPELPCLTVSLSLDRNNTAYGQPELQILPRDLDSIELLELCLDEEEADEFSNSVQIRTRNDNKNLQTVVGYLVDEGDLQRVLRREETQNIRIASFLEKGVPKEILTVDPIIDVFALVRNKQY